MLAKIVKEIFAIPASSSKSERVFSISTKVFFKMYLAKICFNSKILIPIFQAVSAQRNSLNPRSVESIMIIKDNQGRLEEVEESEMVDVEEGLLVFSKIKLDRFQLLMKGLAYFRKTGRWTTLMCLPVVMRTGRRLTVKKTVCDEDVCHSPELELY